MLLDEEMNMAVLLCTVRGHSELPESVHSRCPSSVLTIAAFHTIILALEYPGIISAWSSIRPEVWVTAPVHLTFLQILQSFGGRRTERTEREFKWQWISIQVTAFVGDGDTFA